MKLVLEQEQQLLQQDVRHSIQMLDTLLVDSDLATIKRTHRSEMG